MGFMDRLKRGFGRARVWMLILAVIAALLAVLGPQIGFEEAFLCLLRGAAAAAAIIWGIATFGSQGSPRWRKLHIINTSDRHVKNLEAKREPDAVPPGVPVTKPEIPAGGMWTFQRPYHAPIDYAVKGVKITFDLDDGGGSVVPADIVCSVDTVMWPDPNEYVDEVWLTVYGPTAGPTGPVYHLVTVLRHAKDTADPLNDSPGTFDITV